MKNILVPLDFYGTTQEAWKDLLSFLQGIEGPPTVFLLDTYMVPVSHTGQVIHAHDELRRRSQERLKEELGAVQKLATGGMVRFETVSQMGTPANVICRVILEKGIDGVILGSRNGRGGGSKQEEIVRLLNRINCPVVVLPTQTG